MSSIEFIIPFVMIFCHILDDYRLQGILASLKQKDWWKENAPDDKYKKDYIMALFMHSFSWSFSILLPILIYGIFTDNIWDLYPCALLVNLYIHMFVDDLKANKKKINLIVDQSIHLIQILVTFIIYLFTI